MTAALMRENALAAARAGDHVTATARFAAAARAYPDDPALLNSAGSYHAGRGEQEQALAYFDAALARQPAYSEAILNRAIALQSLGRPGDALRALQSAEPLAASQPRYWSIRGSLEVALDDSDAAARSYDRCLALDGQYARAIHGRTRMALERGEATAPARYERALEVVRGNPDLILGYAQALDSAGRTQDALSIADSLCQQLPSWLPALELAANLRWAMGERGNFCVQHERAAQLPTATASIYHSWCNMLDGVDRYEAAAEVAAKGRRQFPGESSLALREAVHRGEAGDMAGAGAIFATLVLTGTERDLQEARHFLRAQDPQQAEHLLARTLLAEPGNVAGWALRDIAWRQLGDSRHEWLHSHPAFVDLIPSDIAPDRLAAITSLLHQLHDGSAMPVGQSVRDGSQTRGALFKRMEPELRELKAAIERVIERYRSALPAFDPTHPLLRHRNSALRITGSWSIRLAGAGHHVAHIHPLGVLSSAFYLVLPQDADAAEPQGLLEIGRAPADLRLDLPPLRVIQPRIGYCAVFPSTLYHGTTPFSGGRRMTVAFDVTNVKD